MLVGQIQIDATSMLRDAHVNGPLRAIELSAGFEQIESRPDRLAARGVAGGFVVPTPQPGPKAGAANGPGFSVPIDHEIGKCRAVGRVEQLCADRQVDEHGGGRYAGALRGSIRSRCRIQPRRFRCCRLGRGAPLVRGGSVLQSLRATLIGSMPTCFHHARSSPTR